MERRESKARADRREIHSVCMPVPTIVLNNSDYPEHLGLSHSRSAGDLETSVADADYEMAGKPGGMSTFSSSVSDDFQDKTQIDINAIGLYCSPRMTRRSAKSSEEPSAKQSGICLDSLNSCNLNCLDPGSRVGSTVSLNSEYTARSVGLISNDSNSEYSYHNYPVMDGSMQKHSVLKRFYSTPEKDDDMLNYTSSVRRNSKSLGNMQQEDLENFVSFDFGSDSTTDDNNFQQNLTPSCDIDDSLAQRTGYNNDEGAIADGQNDRNLVTLVTGSATLRDGRIRKWLTEISEPDENSNS